jgi:hypothetical protein
LYRVFLTLDTVTHSGRVIPPKINLVAECESFSLVTSQE